MSNAASSKVVIRPGSLSLSEFEAAVRGAEVVLDAGIGQRMARSVDLLRRLLGEGTRVYGVTTGFGGSVDTDVPEGERLELALNLVRFHGCGTGRAFSEEEARAIVVARIASLVRGYSAVRFDVVERLVRLLNAGVVPVIPCEGSVGASGDLTPLSYLAAMLLGEREVLRRGEWVSTSEVLEELSLVPFQLLPKESLALMNGTSVMTGLACVASEQARRLCRWASRLTALCSDVTLGQRGHFDARLFELKPHPGQAASARWIRTDMLERAPTRDVSLQDRYSLRCAPHVIGVALDYLLLQRPMLEAELNSVNDNPIVDVDTETVLHGGNFYGGHICQAMDTLKTCIANVADLMDRQLLLLCDPNTNRGLPANLVASEPSASHHGFKAMQITTSALVAEANKACMPASVFSRSTENHNQDKVSLGTIAARDCLRILELAERVLAVHTLALAQAVDLRGPDEVGLRARELYGAVRRSVPKLEADRRMDGDIQRVVALHRTWQLPIGEIDLEPIDPHRVDLRAQDRD